MRENLPMPLDQIDLRILKELQNNARISIAALATNVALTATPCARRVQQLEAAGYIARDCFRRGSPHARA